MTDPKTFSTLLGELDAKVEKMTPGPWSVDIDEYDIGEYSVSIPEIQRTLHDSEWADPKVAPRDTANALGIVALVNAYPALKEGIESLQGASDMQGALVNELLDEIGGWQNEVAALKEGIERLERENKRLQSMVDSVRTHATCLSFNEKWCPTPEKARRREEAFEMLECFWDAVADGSWDIIRAVGEMESLATEGATPGVPEKQNPQ